MNGQSPEEYEGVAAFYKTRIERGPRYPDGCHHSCVVITGRTSDAVLLRAEFERHQLGACMHPGRLECHKDFYLLARKLWVKEAK